MKKNLVTPATRLKFKKATSSFMNFLVIITLVTVSYCIGYYKEDLDNMISNKEQNFSEVHTYANTTVSVTDRNELMIIDRSTQEMHMYEDTVGLLIFNAYSNTLLTKKAIEK